MNLNLTVGVGKSNKKATVYIFGNGLKSAMITKGSAKLDEVKVKKTSDQREYLECKLSGLKDASGKGGVDETEEIEITVTNSTNSREPVTIRTFTP